MYDKEKGIYPQGHYVAGQDLPLGSYLLTPIDGEQGDLKVYKSYEDFLNKDQIIWELFNSEYFVRIMSENSYVVVTGASIQRVS